jgi:hypothetical protein
MTQHIEDPRLLPTLLRLPQYAAAWRQWGEHTEVGRSLIFLGVKLTEAEDYRRRLAEVDVARLGIPAQRAFSRDLDAFVFVTYGALDALSQVVAAVAEAHTQREIKFPLLSGILAEDVRQPERWARFAGWLETLYLAPWYVDVRRLRNLINYGSVLSAPLNWPPDAHEVRQWLSTYDRVLATVEHGLALVLEAEPRSPLVR